MYETVRSHGNFSTPLCSRPVLPNPFQPTLTFFQKAFYVSAVFKLLVAHLERHGPLQHSYCREDESWCMYMVQWITVPSNAEFCCICKSTVLSSHVLAVGYLCNISCSLDFCPSIFFARSHRFLTGEVSLWGIFLLILLLKYSLMIVHKVSSYRPIRACCFRVITDFEA